MIWATSQPGSIRTSPTTRSNSRPTPTSSSSTTRQYDQRQARGALRQRPDRPVRRHPQPRRPEPLLSSPSRSTGRSSPAGQSSAARSTTTSTTMGRSTCGDPASSGWTVELTNTATRRGLLPRPPTAGGLFSLSRCPGRGPTHSPRSFSPGSSRRNPPPRARIPSRSRPARPSRAKSSATTRPRRSAGERVQRPQRRWHARRAATRA